MKTWNKHLLLFAATLLAVPLLARGGFTLTEISPQTKACAECHKKESPSLYTQWGSSKHYRGNVGCYECHMALTNDVDAFEHYGQIISTIVTPKDCGRCHEAEVTEFNSSHHAKAGRILGSLDNTLAEVVEGNKGLKTSMFPGGVSAAAVNGCWQCHGTEIKIMANHKPDPATWPNTGIGRINPDGREGSCAACHSRHEFSAAQARTPDTCGKCHMGPDHPQIEIYNESKHGILYAAKKEQLNLDSAKWVVGQDYTAAPTCATCHMGATPNQPATHDVGSRISWTLRPPVSKKLPDADKRRAAMKDVCGSCHSETFIEGHYKQFDDLVDLYEVEAHQFLDAEARNVELLAEAILKALGAGRAAEADCFDRARASGITELADQRRVIVARPAFTAAREGRREAADGQMSLPGPAVVVLLAVVPVEISQRWEVGTNACNRVVDQLWKRKSNVTSVLKLAPLPNNQKSYRLKRGRQNAVPDSPSHKRMLICSKHPAQ